MKIKKSRKKYNGQFSFFSKKTRLNRNPVEEEEEEQKEKEQKRIGRILARKKEREKRKRAFYLWI